MKSLIQKTLSLESIDFLSTAFRDELILAFTELKQVKKADISDSEVIPRVCAIIKHHTGLNVILNVGAIDASVDIPAVNKNNPLINSFIRDYVSSSDGMRMINNAGGACRGTVNLRTGRVSGIFAEVQSTINLPVDMFVSSQFTPGEIAAITQHEIGHLVTYYEFLARTVTTNQVLAGMSKALDGSGTVDEREAVLINVKKAMGLTDLDTKALAKSTNHKVSEIVVISNVTKKAASELGSNVYDFSTWEALSDNYATRCGSGRDLATALEKLYRGSWNISFRSLPAYLAMEALKLTMVFVIPGITFALMVMDGRGDGTYDQPGQRIKRVRNQIVENLKIKGITKETHDALQADLTAIDSILETATDRRQLTSLIWDTLIPSARRELNQERLQQDLENIAASDLFVKAAELRQLA